MPPLQGVKLFEVSVNREGPSMRLRLDLAAYPENPPKKWSAQGFNVVHVELYFGGVDSVRMAGISVNPVVDISLRRGEKISLEVRSPEVNVSATADSVHILRMQAHADEEPAG
ncbi:hypothetical protein HCK00_16350 [Streptomyces sp. PLAI1-29]|uniref:Uncharacterized protein n=1 Tax=Streptomyces zingiberis TaxID=2053010 RepID=A0ABX1BY74_9ACTN|nr:hypothetical protein [Streptomyces zingiberis]